MKAILHLFICTFHFTRPFAELYTCPIIVYQSDRRHPYLILSGTSFVDFVYVIITEIIWR